MGKRIVATEDSPESTPTKKGAFVMVMENGKLTKKSTADVAASAAATGASTATALAKSGGKTGRLRVNGGEQSPPSDTVAVKRAKRNNGAAAAVEVVSVDLGSDDEATIITTTTTATTTTTTKIAKQTKRKRGANGKAATKAAAPSASTDAGAKKKSKRSTRTTRDLKASLGSDPDAKNKPRSTRPRKQKEAVIESVESTTEQTTPTEAVVESGDTVMEGGVESEATDAAEAAPAKPAPKKRRKKKVAIEEEDDEPAPIRPKPSAPRAKKYVTRGVFSRSARLGVPPTVTASRGSEDSDKKSSKKSKKGSSTKKKTPAKRKGGRKGDNNTSDDVGEILPLPINYGEFLLTTQKPFTLPYEYLYEKMLEDYVVYLRRETDEGPYKSINKNIYVGRSMRKIKNLDRSEIAVCQCELARGRSTTGCHEGCVNRSLFIECVPGFCPCGEKKCENMRIQKAQAKPVTMNVSGKKGRGLYTEVDLKGGDFIIEYVGEIVDVDEADLRLNEYRGEKHQYIMEINASEVIDATRKGGIARFLNHSCDPNCEAQKWWVNGETRIGIFAIHDIPAGTELTYDYGWTRYGGSEKVRCLCGTAKCSGFLGDKRKKESKKRKKPRRMSKAEKEARREIFKARRHKVYGDDADERTIAKVTKSHLILMRNVRKVYDAKGRKIEDWLASLNAPTTPQLTEEQIEEQRKAERARRLAKRRTDERSTKNKHKNKNKQEIESEGVSESVRGSEESVVSDTTTSVTPALGDTEMTEAQ